MKKVLIGFLLAWSTALSPEADALNYQTLGEGMEYASLEVADSEVQLKLLRLDLNKVSVLPLKVDQSPEENLNARQLAEKYQALAVLNANFFDEGGKALGLVMHNGEIKNPFHPTPWWATLLLGEDHAKITKIFKKNQIGVFKHGIQAGPRLVIQGRVPQLKNKSSAKSAVGIDAQGRLILVATQGILNMNQFANLLAKPQNQGGVGLQDALNLDGGSSTQFYIKAGGFEYWLPGLSKIPVGLGVFAK